MSKVAFPMTQAIRELKSKKIEFEPFLYEYEEKGGTAQTAKLLNVDEHHVVKTIVVTNDEGKLAIVLMNGDKEISLKELARQIGARSCSLCDAAIAKKSTGYEFGGTSPFGILKPLPIYFEKEIADIEYIYINGGKRGFIIKVKTSEIISLLKATPVSVAID